MSAFDEELSRIRTIIDGLEQRYQAHSTAVEKLVEEARTHVKHLVKAVQCAAEACPGTCEDPQGPTLRDTYKQANNYLLSLATKIEEVKDNKPYNQKRRKKNGKINY